ncbi:MAG: polyether ionophore transport system permease protein [Solirubrobacteraceae bacterium]|nr:polyether ionophore transport system permease protein [Solirubrobacteraceae bacterium]
MSALLRRALREARARTIAFAALFAVYAYVQPAGYRSAYPTLGDRRAFGEGFADNLGLRLFYGEPHDLLGVEGYTAWRVGGTLAIAAAVFGLLAAVRALRHEEDTGRMELVLAAPVGRRTTYRAALAAIAAGTALLWFAQLAGFLAGGLPAGGSAYLALATVSVVPVCAGIGAVACQIAPNRRVALQLGGAVVGLCFLLRVIADTADGVGWLRWATPLGWAEELRPFTGAEPLVLALPLAVSVLLLVGAGRIAARRDIGTGLLPAHDTAEPRLALLSSPAAQALRTERTGLIVWAGGAALFAFILGIVSKGVTSADLPEGVQEQIAKLGSASLATPTGYLAFIFVFFVLALSLFAVAQVGAARHAEAEQQLETLFAQPVGRGRWLAGRLLLAACAAVVICLVAGLMTWAGAAAAGVDVSLPRMLEAGANCLPVALLFLGVAALAYALAPRAGGGIAYGLVTVAFAWQLVGSLLGAPAWLVDLTPFAHVALVPTQPFAAGAAAVMLALGGLAALLALGAFRRRDIVGA